MKITTRLEGIKDVDRLLSQIAPKQARNIMRSTIHDMAGKVRDDAKQAMPVDEGTMKRGTKAKRERLQAFDDRVRSTVRVNRKAFYWRFLEYGDGPDGVEHAFFLKATQKMSVSMNALFLASFGKKFEQTLARARKRRGG